MVGLSHIGSLLSIGILIIVILLLTVTRPRDKRMEREGILTDFGLYRSGVIKPMVTESGVTVIPKFNSIVGATTL